MPSANSEDGEILFLYGSSELMFDSAYSTLNFTRPLAMIVNSNHRQDSRGIFPDCKVTLSGEIHQFVPCAFDQSAKSGHLVVEATVLNYLDDPRNVGAG